MAATQPDDAVPNPPPELESLVFACLEAEDPDAELDRRTQGRPDLRPAARRLLARVRAREEPTPTASAGLQIPPYHILSELGSGGMGTVYLAEQRAPIKRRVALKVIKLGMDTKAVLARFEAERQALAMMDHTSIAKVFDVGVTPQGRPYFAMEYVKGVPITRYCDDNKLSIEDRLALFRQVCSGVQHAHTKGVIHRDLTPNNVLVSVQDGRPVAKIIDFGLARATDHKLTEKTLFTEQGVILGTPEYMSPEQAGLNALDIDMRSDVYTLGVLLYELLTGSLPFSRDQLRQAGYDKMCAIIRTQEPERPSTKITKVRKDTQLVAQLRRTDSDKLVRRLRGDLDWVVLKCLEKDRTRRYETVSQLAEDVQRHLDDETVLARAPSVGYRLAKFARRYRGQLAAAVLVLVALVAGLGLATYFWLDARAQARGAEIARVGEAAKAKESAEHAVNAQRSATEALSRKREFDQLAGVVYLERALEAEKKLYPPWPEQIDAMQRWLDVDAGRLLAMQPEIERTVAGLRARVVPTMPEAPVDSALEAETFLHDALSDLLRRLASLTGKERKAVEQSLAWARRIEALTLGHPKARVTWQQASEAIVRADGAVASERYREIPIDLKPQMGLIPIGMNPSTRLWEFYELRSAWDGALDPASIEIPRQVEGGERAGHIDMQDDTGIVFVLLPGGTFQMGAQSVDPSSANYDPECLDHETLYEVTLAPFFLARHELTQGQWKRLSRGETPSNNPVGASVHGGPTIRWTNPVEQVTWNTTIALLSRHGLALPTEAQWEYGCRAATTTPWVCPRERLADFANLADATAKRAVPSWTCEEWDDGHLVHAPAGTFLPNGFGLYDMHGNVGEWTQDGSFWPRTQPRPVDGLQGDPSGSDARIVRGPLCQRE